MTWHVYRKPLEAGLAKGEWTDANVAYDGRHHCGNLCNLPKVTLGRVAAVLPLLWLPWAIALVWWQAIPLGIVLMDLSVILAVTAGPVAKWPGNLLIVQFMLVHMAKEGLCSLWDLLLESLSV